MKQNKIIAITGGIGSGKSLAIEVLKEEGYKVISADETYKEMLLDEEFVKGIYSILDIPYMGKFNKNEVSSIVFNSKEQLQKLNDYTHPKIMKKMFEMSDGITIHEVPLLFESGLEKEYSNVIVIKRDLDKRINDVERRDNISKDEIMLRVSNQFDYQNLEDNVTVIENNGSKKEFSNKVLEVVGNLVMDKIGEEMGMNIEEGKVAIENPIDNYVYEKKEDKKNTSFVAACIGLILDIFFGLGFIMCMIVFLRVCKKDQTKTTNRWAKMISMIGVIFGVVFLASAIILLTYQTISILN